MKHLLKPLRIVSLAAFALTAAPPAVHAQTKATVTAPSWGPALPAGKRYYYIPEVDGFYDVPAREYVVKRSGRWIRATSLQGANTTTFHPVVMDYLGSEPWSLYTAYQAKYDKATVTAPSWGPALPAGKRYYYIPEVDGFYDVPAREYVVKRSGRWIRATSLQGANTTTFHPVVMDYLGSEPWSLYTAYQAKYDKATVTAPSWGPALPAGKRYYYIPEVDGFYDVPAREYVVKRSGRWIRATSLQGANTTTFHPVVMDYLGSEPWSLYTAYQAKYDKATVTAPSWGPALPAGKRYYYIPEVDGFYDVPAREYVVKRSGRWIRATSLQGANTTTFHPVVMDYLGSEPWSLYTAYQAKYDKATVTAPSWGPALPAGKRYYYIPEVDGFYDVPAREYVVKRSGRWIRATSLQGANTTTFHPVVMDYLGSEPWSLYTAYQAKYDKPTSSK